MKNLNPKIALIFFISVFALYLSFDFGVRNVDAIVIPDTFENVLNGYYTANGLKTYSDFATNHFPGVFQILGVVYNLTEVSSLNPEPGALASRLMHIAILVSVLIQLSSVWLACRFAQINRLFGIALGASFLAWMASKFNGHLPFSENWIAFLFVPACTAAARTLGVLPPAPNEDALRFEASFFLCLLFPFVSNWIGLTAAPSTIVFGFAGLGGLFLLFRDSFFSTGYFNRIKIILPQAIILVLALLLFLAHTDIKGLFFWNLDFNKSLPVDPVASLTGSWQIQFSTGIDRNFTIFARYPSVIFACSLVIIAALKSRISRMAIFSYGTAILLAMALMTWRVPYGIKTLPLYGLFLGNVIIAIRLRWQSIQLGTMNPTTLTGLSLAPSVVLLLVCGSKYGEMADALFAPLPQAARLAAYDEANLCRFHGSQENCKCVRHTIWSPTAYLDNDVRQCRGWGIWLPMIAEHPVTLQKVITDSHDANVAFLAMPDKWLRDGKVPEEVISSLSRRRCLEADHPLARICF